MSLMDDILFWSDSEDDSSIPVLAPRDVPKVIEHPAVQLPPCTSPVCKTVKEALADARAFLERNHQPVTLHTIATLLGSTYGEFLRVRHVPGGATQAERMCHQSHDYLVVRFDDTEEVLIDIDFQERFLVSRTTVDYARLLEALPVDFVGTMSDLRETIRVVSKGLVEDFYHYGMPVPPWRQYRNLLCLWDGPHRFDYSVQELKDAQSSSYPELDSTDGNGWMTPAQAGLSPVPAVIVEGFPAGKSLYGYGPLKVTSTIVPKLPASRATTEQLDKLLGPVYKVKLRIT